MMLDKLKSIFTGAPAGANAAQEAADAEASLRLAVAGLLVEAARADEDYTLKEQKIIDQALGARFGLDQEASAALRAQAETVQDEAVDLHQFTKVAKDLSIEDKTRLIETLWRVVLSDGDRDAHEDALIRRICGLIYFSDRESGEARQRVEASLA